MPLGNPSPFPALQNNAKTASQIRSDRLNANPKPMADGTYGRDPFTNARLNREQAINAMRPGSELQQRIENTNFADRQLQIAAYRNQLMKQAGWVKD